MPPREPLLKLGYSLTIEGESRDYSIMCVLLLRGWVYVIRANFVR
jgi:hypothetical protein